MSLPSYSPLSGTQFRVGFGPRGTNQRLILTEVHVDRIAKCDGKIVVDPGAARSGVDVITANPGCRYKKIIRIPCALSNEENVAGAIREALQRANGNLCNRVALTPLGYTHDGLLSPDQSARAILGAIYALWAGEGNQVPHQILISIHADSMAYQDFEVALDRHFFPHRRAENPNSGLSWKKSLTRWGSRMRKIGQILLERLQDLSGNRGRDAALAIHEIAQKRPDIFKAKDVDMMAPYDHYEGIPETLLILRNLGGKIGEAARMALFSSERTAAMDAVREEMQFIAKADNEELALAVSAKREDFLETLALGLALTGVDYMNSSHENVWGKLAMITLKDDRGVVQPQFIQFHRAESTSLSPARSKLFTMGMRVANRDEAEKLLQQMRATALARYGSKANMGSHRLDGSQEWFLNLCVDYRERTSSLDSDWHVSSLPEDIGRGMLYFHFQNHAESSEDSHRVLRILAEEFGLTFVSPRAD